MPESDAGYRPQDRALNEITPDEAAKIARKLTEIYSAPETGSLRAVLLYRDTLEPAMQCTIPVEVVELTVAPGQPAMQMPQRDPLARTFRRVYREKEIAVFLEVLAPGSES